MHLGPASKHIPHARTKTNTSTLSLPWYTHHLEFSSSSSFKSALWKNDCFSSLQSELSHLDQPGAPYTVVLQGNQTEKSLATTIHKTRKRFHNQNHWHLKSQKWRNICITSHVVTKCESLAHKIEYHQTKPDNDVNLWSISYSVQPIQHVLIPSKRARRNTQQIS